MRLHENKTYRLLIHFPIGAWNAWVILKSPLLGTLFFVMFLAYEITEDWRIKDKGYLDIAGWLWGAWAMGTYFLVKGV